MKPERWSLSRRLVVAQFAVVLAMAAVMVLVAEIIAPTVFAAHMREAGHGDQPEVLDHAQEAFTSAGLTSIVVGLVLATIVATLVSLVVTRRLGRGLDALSVGASRVASGDYDRPVDMPHTGRELDAVADAFNDMAHRLATTEATRRRLLTDVAHEMRTPLAALDLVLEGLEDGVVAADVATFATLRTQADRLTRLATDLRDVSAAEEGRLDLRPEPVDLATVASGAVAGARAAYDQVGVRLDARTTSAPVRADPARLGQVLDNLLANALRHTPEGGSVVVTVVKEGQTARLVVADTGGGIAPEHLSHVFERFYRADPARRAPDAGTGVGLSISRAIAQAHGGTLIASSPGPGQGATFTLTLPAAP